MIPTTAFEKRLLELENQLFDHLLGRQITVQFTLRDREALEVFGERYGSMALRQKVLGMLRTKFSKEQLTKLILQAKRESRFYAQRILLHNQQGKDLAPATYSKLESTPSKPLSTKAQSKRLRKQIHATTRPLVQSFITLEFYHQVMGNYFSDAEQKEWIEALADQSNPDSLAECIAAIEDRAGKSLIDLVSGVTQEAERRVVAIIVDSVEEYRAIERKGLVQPMMEALEHQNWTELLKHYQVLAS